MKRLQAGPHLSLACILFLGAGCGDPLPGWIEAPLPSGDDDVAEEEQPESLAFRPQIQADIDQLGCSTVACHGSPDFFMPLVPSPVDDGDWWANYQQVKQRAGDGSSSLLMAKALGDGGHIAPLSEEDPVIVRWTSWIAQGAPYTLDGSTGQGGTGGAGGSSGGEGGGGGSSSGGAPSGELTWDGDVFPIIVANACLDCHGASGWQGAYSLASYPAAMGFGSDDVPNIVPGDASSKLVEYTQEGHHGISSADALVIETWIVTWEAQEN